MLRVECVLWCGIRSCECIGRDEEFDTLVLDEDSENNLLDHMEPLMAPGGKVVEFHSCSIFPE